MSAAPAAATPNTADTANTTNATGAAVAVPSAANVLAGAEGTGDASESAVVAALREELRAREALAASRVRLERLVESHNASLRAENQRLAEQLVCLACGAVPKDALALPCRHLALCCSCMAGHVAAYGRVCPACRLPVQDVLAIVSIVPTQPTTQATPTLDDRR